MSSISDNWGRRFKSDEPVLESELARDGATGHVAGLLAHVPSDDPSPEHELAAKENIDAVRRLFESDELVTLIIFELEEGAKLRAIREQYDVSENDFNAALKRLRRGISRLYEERGDG